MTERLLMRQVREILRLKYEQGLPQRVLCVIDGGKGLRKGLGDVFGDAAMIQRCQLHKGRNLDALVPKARQAYVRAALRRAYQAASVAAARHQLTPSRRGWSGTGMPMPRPVCAKGWRKR